LSVCVIARDERENLEVLIPSVIDLADEVVVVDTGSVDGTRERAAALGARVVEFAWCDDFAAARNAGLDAAGCRWVLWLDADERVDRSQWASIRRFVASGGAEAVSLLLESTHDANDAVSCSRGRYCRLFRADLGARFEGRVHEQILPALERRCARVVEADVVIRHLGYAMDEATMRRKKLRNLALLRQAASESPGDYYTCFQLGATLIALGEFAEAIEPLERSKQLRHDHAPLEIVVWTELRLAQAHCVTGDLDACERHVRGALRRAGHVDMAHFILAGCSAKRGRPLRTLVSLRRILRSHPDSIAPMRRESVRADFDRLAAALSTAGLLRRPLREVRSLAPHEPVGSR
jgi:tetratricopeptide (TPR) repeat protein